MLRTFPRHIRLLLLLSICCAFSCGAGRRQADVEAVLERLDSVLTLHDKLVEKKEIRIDGLRHTFYNSGNDAERLGVSRMLYDEYLVFDSDSALHYARQTRHLLERTCPEDYSQLTEWKLNEAFIHTVQGHFEKALEVLNSIDTSRLSPEEKSRYFDTISYAYSLYSVYLYDNHEEWRSHIDKANAYRDSICALHLPPSEDWMWVPLSIATEKEPKDVTGVDISAIKQSVDSSITPSRKNAINSYWLARYYEVANKPDSAIYYMANAAICDALIVNREIAAVHELAIILFDRGDLNRAYNYLMYDSHQSNLYHNRFRIVALANILPSVRDAYLNEIHKRDRRLATYVWVLAGLSIALALLIVLLIMEFRRLKKTRDLLNTANSDLSASIAQRDKAIASLEKSNADLVEANKQKLSILAYTFKLTTQHINALEDYRKKLLRRFRSKQFDELGVLLNDPELMKERFQGFYESFDKTVLSLFPDLVDDYNAGADDDNKLSAASVAKTRSLNTRLRIHALRRLGVSKSADIAQMLNVSIRTVYNNRSNSASGADEQAD